MARLSERIGLTQARSLIQTDSLDTATRTALWNSYVLVRDLMWKHSGYGEEPNDDLLRKLWAGHLERPLDEYTRSGAEKAMREITFDGEWILVLELVEFLARNLNWKASGEIYISYATQDFEKYLVGFRFINEELVPVTDDSEIAAMQQAMSGTGAGAGARRHLERATRLLSERTHPQYAKVIAEAISAVESVVYELTGEKVLSSGLRKLDAKGTTTHAALVAGWDKLYGYTSDASGIRHGLVRDEDATEPLAVYFLVSCSAFINLLLKQSAST